MTSDSACDFLAATETRYFYIPDDEKKHPALDLLLRKKHRELLELVTEGAVSVKETLHPLNVSLLELSLKRNPVLNDVSVLLDALKLKGEKLEEVHLDRACTCASPALIQLLLSHGAPLGPNALHCLVERFPFGANKQAVLESINLMIEAKAEIDALGSSPFSSVTPLTTASGALSLPKEVIQCLLDFRADPLGGKGTRSPLHAHVAQWGSPAGVELLVKNRADVNARDASGKTPVHIALAGHPKFNLAMCLKSLGADVTVADHQGVTPRQILLKHNSPAQAAELEGRSELNAEELRLQQALDHPLAKKFQASAFAAVSWILSRTPEDGFGGICNNELTEDFPYGDRRLSECLGGHVPKHLVLQLPLTRYSELLGDLCLKSPEPEGFTVRGVLNLQRAWHGGALHLMEIYKFYQEPFSKEELSEINAHFGRGCLGDTFGYIQNNVAEDEGQEQQKKQRVPRLNLRGDSFFFEGFRSCKYFEDDQSLWGTLSLGS